jgi:hypothetical protein
MGSESIKNFFFDLLSLKCQINNLVDKSEIPGRSWR